MLQSMNSDGKLSIKETLAFMILKISIMDPTMPETYIILINWVIL